MRNQFLVITFGMILVMGCSSADCRRQSSNNFFAEKTKDLPEFKEKVAQKTGLGQGATDWIMVFKADGSLQCGMGQAISPDEMSRQLTEKGIRIKKAIKRSDGLMRIQLCGSPTGMINVFEIQASNLDLAKELGFAVFVQP